MNVYHDYGHTLIVMDGARIVAKAVKIVSGGWRLRSYEGCWVDLRAREVNKVTRTVMPQYLRVSERRQAVRIMKGLEP